MKENFYRTHVFNKNKSLVTFHFHPLPFHQSPKREMVGNREINGFIYPSNPTLNQTRAGKGPWGVCDAFQLSESFNVMSLFITFSNDVMSGSVSQRKKRSLLSQRSILDLVGLLFHFPLSSLFLIYFFTMSALSIHTWKIW